MDADFAIQNATFAAMNVMKDLFDAPVVVASAGNYLLLSPSVVLLPNPTFIRTLL